MRHLHVTIFFLDKVVKLIGGVSVINGAYPVQFLKSALILYNLNFYSNGPQADSVYYLRCLFVVIYIKSKEIKKSQETHIVVRKKIRKFEWYLLSQLCQLRRQVFDKSSPVHLVSESRGGGPESDEGGGWTDILVSNIWYFFFVVFHLIGSTICTHCAIQCLLRQETAK